MSTLDPGEGWEDDASAEAYAAFSREFPMYVASSRDLALRARLDRAELVVDLCGGVGVTAEAILGVAPTSARVISVDRSAAMQRVGRRRVPDPRVTWITAPAEDLAHLVPDQVDAVVCNSAIWDTDTQLVFDAVRNVLRPGGRLVFNVSGGIAGLRRDDGQADSGPSLISLVYQVAVEEFGVESLSAGRTPPTFPMEVIGPQLDSAGLTTVSTEVLSYAGTMQEKKAWLTLPMFSFPRAHLTYPQRMALLDKAYARTQPQALTVTNWLVVVAANGDGPD